MKKLSVLFSTILLVAGLSTSAHAIPGASFVPFGSDTAIAANDDGFSGTFALNTPITFFGEAETFASVNNNGNITFDGTLSTFTPFAFPGSREIVAPYFGDVDTRGIGSGLVYYGQRDAGHADLTGISSVVNSAGFGGTYTGTYALVATWDHVGYFGSHTDLLNTFQAVVTTDGVDTFAIFNYLDDGMFWETGDASGGSGGFGGTEATAGFDAGNSIDFATIPGSFAPGIAKALEDGSNIGVAGQWVFRINDGEIIGGQNPGENVVPEPATMALFGTGLVGAFVRRRKRA